MKQAELNPSRFFDFRSLTLDSLEGGREILVSKFKK